MSPVNFLKHGYIVTTRFPILTWFGKMIAIPSLQYIFDVPPSNTSCSPPLSSSTTGWWTPSARSGRGSPQLWIFPMKLEHCHDMPWRSRFHKPSFDKIPELDLGKFFAFLLPRRILQSSPWWSEKISEGNWDYPLVNWHSNGKSPFFMGKSTINGNFQLLC